jgi:aspartyl-tRNA(Asn)/glutamyl-tRNA(Gln) amidotransferase subunit A
LTGVTRLSPSLDHCAVLAADAQTAARVLAVIADRPDIAVAAAAEQGRGVDGLPIGILTSRPAHEALDGELGTRHGGLSKGSQRRTRRALLPGRDGGLQPRGAHR